MSCMAVEAGLLFCCGCLLQLLIAVPETELRRGALRGASEIEIGMCMLLGGCLHSGFIICECCKVNPWHRCILLGTTSILLGHRSCWALDGKTSWYNIARSARLQNPVVIFSLIAHGWFLISYDV